MGAPSPFSRPAQGRAVFLTSAALSQRAAWMVGHLPGAGTGHFGMVGCLYMYVGLYVCLKPQKQMF